MSRTPGPSSSPSHRSGPAHTPSPASMACPHLQGRAPPRCPSGARSPPAHKELLSGRGNVWCQESGVPRKAAFSSPPPAPSTSQARPAWSSAGRAGVGRPAASRGRWCSARGPRGPRSRPARTAFILPGTLHTDGQARLLPRGRGRQQRVLHSLQGLASGPASGPAAHPAGLLATPARLHLRGDKGDGRLRTHPSCVLGALTRTRPSPFPVPLLPPSRRLPLPPSPSSLPPPLLWEVLSEDSQVPPSAPLLPGHASLCFRTRWGSVLCPLSLSPSHTIYTLSR